MKRLLLTLLLILCPFSVGAVVELDGDSNGATDIDKGGTNAQTAATAYGNIKQSGTSSAAGALELATDGETVTGTDTARAVTPANLTAKMAAPGPIGGTTQDTGDFTTVSATVGVIAPVYNSNAADGDRRQVYETNTGITPDAGKESLYSLNGVLTYAENGAEKGKVITGGKDLTDVNLGTLLLSSTQTLAAGGMQGQHYYITGLYTITLPAVTDGAWGCFQTIGANAGTIDPNASDLIFLNGTAQADGVAIESDGTTGQQVCLAYYDATGWATWGGQAWVSE